MAKLFNDKMTNMKNNKILELKMEDGSSVEFDTEFFTFENVDYCLLTPADQNCQYKPVVRKAAWSTDGVQLFEIEDSEEHQRVMDYLLLLEKLEKCLLALDEGEQYRFLTTCNLPAKQYTIDNLGEGMEVVSEKMYGWWKQRFVLNHNTKKAWEFMNKNQILCTVTHEDIDWEAVNQLPHKAINHAIRLSAHFPTNIRPYKDGVAWVRWQLTPDGRYYMDADGYGMTDDDEIAICGQIDQHGKVVRKFR